MKKVIQFIKAIDSEIASMIIDAMILIIIALVMASFSLVLKVNNDYQDAVKFYNDETKSKVIQLEQEVWKDGKQTTPYQVCGYETVFGFVPIGEKICR